MGENFNLCLENEKMKDYALFSNYELFYVSKFLYLKLVFMLVKYSFTSDFTFYRKIKRNTFEINGRIIDEMKSDGLKGYIRDLFKVLKISQTRGDICIV